MSDINIVLENRDDIRVAVKEKDINVEVPAGKDGRSLRPRGEWDASVAYAYLDLVGYQGSSYVALKAVPAGTLPTDTSYWMLSAEKGGPGTPVWGDITGDLSDQTDLADALLAKAPVIISSASGSIASFSDGSPAPVTALTVGIEPVQDLHGYDNPWPAGGGANIWDEQWELGTFQGGELKPSSTRIRNLNPIKVTPNETYRLVSSIGVFVMKINAATGWTQYESSLVNAGATFTVPSWAEYIYISPNDGYGATYKNDIAINYPSTVTTYQPYSNICPISGWSQATVTRTGINIWDEEWELGTISLSTGQNTSSSSRIRSKNYIRVDPSEIYWFTGTNNNAEVLFYDKYKNYISYRNPDMPKVGGPLNQPNNCYFVRFVMYSSYGTTYNNDISINYPATDTQYHAYQGQSVIIDLDGTRYGGTLNVLTGEMVVTHKITLIGDISSLTYDSTYHRFIGTISDMKSNNNPRVQKVLSDVYQPIYDGRAIENVPDYSISSGAGRGVNIYDSRYNNAATYKTAMGSSQILYPIDSLTVQLTPAQMQTLLGENHIWSDTGDTAVEYRADTKLFIEKLTKPTEDDMTANTNISANTFFMVGNNLYFATSAIATGTSIVPGSNCTALSLADALNNLNA